MTDDEILRSYRTKSTAAHVREMAERGVPIGQYRRVLIRDLARFAVKWAAAVDLAWLAKELVVWWARGGH